MTNPLADDWKSTGDQLLASLWNLITTVGLAPSGTTTNPGMAFADEPGTGFSRPAAGTMAASVLGVEQARLTQGALSLTGAALNQLRAAPVAAAATVDLGGVKGNYVPITGSASITSLGTAQAGAERLLRFDGASTLVQDPTKIILPGGASITTAAGDLAWVVSEGGGLWRCVEFWSAASPFLRINGNGSQVTAIAAGGSVLRTNAARFGERLSLYDIGCACDGTTDDAAAITAFFATTSLTGGVLALPYEGQVYLGSSVTIASGWTIEGLAGAQGVTDNGTESYYDRGAQIKLGPGATLRHGGDGEVRNLLVIRSGLTQPVPNATVAALLVSQFSGTAIECAGEDVTIRGCLILGHAVGIDSKGKARTKVLDTGVDCQAGVLISGGWDISRLERVHVWPFMTATAPGVHGGSDATAAPLRRTGVGIEFSADSGGNCDWSTALDCFSYGHAINYSQRDVSNISWVRCQCDYTAPNTGSLYGFSITGTTTYPALINCTGVSQATCVYVDTTGGVLQDNGVRVIGGVWAASGTNINIANGAAVVHGNQFYSGSNGIVLGAGADPGSIIGNYFQNVADPLVIDAAVIDKTEILGNSYDGVTEAQGNRLNANLMVKASSGAVTITDTRALTQGIGGALVLSGPFASGSYGSYAGARGHLIAGTTGNEAADLVFQARRLGSLVDYLRLDHDGNLLPEVDNAYANGSDTKRWRSVRAVLGQFDDVAYGGLVKVSATSQVDSGTALTLYAVNAIQRVRLTNNATITLPALTLSGTERSEITLELVQDGTGNRSVTWATQVGDSIAWDGSAVAPAIATTAGYETHIVFRRRAGSAVWYASKIWQQGS
ncbi:hypothetical protein FBZ84_101199 [Azospirillum baldaniorum]|uniref:hypothetical protein n=1 Tax=Azospirillum baldaniorum TaxID=1064539 RepID=UPI0011ACD35D|nr:hypothetical protein [Azospirillum baldaniorum]TWA71933.1 hypothetical protein FBZ84_101199 [Azospirillum baldaniorum]